MLTFGFIKPFKNDKIRPAGTDRYAATAKPERKPRTTHLIYRIYTHFDAPQSKVRKS